MSTTLFCWLRLGNLINDPFYFFFKQQQKSIFKQQQKSIFLKLLEVDKSHQMLIS